MNFKKYPEINNATKIYIIDVKEKGEWVVLEKIHGANVAGYCDGTIVQFAKRTSFINQSDYKGFYGCENVVTAHTEKILKLFKICGAKKYIIVYDELFGGFYPGYPSQGPLIQKGVYYSPSQAFYAFDLCIDDTRFVNYTKAITYFQEAELFYAHILYSSHDLTSALEWSNVHKQDITTIPDYFKLPPIKNNFMEGHVLKLVEQPEMPIFFKNKNSAFLEVQKAKKVKVDPESADNLVEDITRFITQQRYDNMISKVGPETSKGELVKLLTEDAIKDYKKEYGEKLQLTKEQMKKIYNASQKIVFKKN